MKKELRLLVFYIFTFFAVHLQAVDLEKDQEFVSVISSEEFVNGLIYYEFEDNKYPIRIIHNPKGETLWGPDSKEPSSLRLIILADLPIPLAHYIEDLVFELKGSHDDCYYLLKNGNPVKHWISISPVHIAESIDDSINNEFIEKVFSSTRFVNQVIYYRLNDRYYQVRLLHNPLGKTYSSTNQFRLEQDAPYDTYCFSWNKIYGIGIDKKAPQALVNHLTASLKNISNWDWYLNFSLENGTSVFYFYNGINKKINYRLDTWFNMTKNLSQDPDYYVK